MKQTTKQVERDEKYLTFLIDIYSKCNKEYNKVDLSKLMIEHKVDSKSSVTLKQLGFLKSVGTNSNMYYHFPQEPSYEMAEQLRKGILTYKKSQVSLRAVKSKEQAKVKDSFIKINKTPKVKIGKTKVVKVEEPKVTMETPQTATLDRVIGYKNRLRALLVDYTSESRTESLESLTKKHKCSTRTPRVIAKFYCKKGKGSLEWKGGKITDSLIEEIYQKQLEVNRKERMKTLAKMKARVKNVAKVNKPSVKTTVPVKKETFVTKIVNWFKKW